MVINNATMENNQGQNGGVINVINVASAVITGGSLIRNNTADNGGGLIANLYCKITLDGCTFMDNRATGTNIVPSFELAVARL